MKQFGVALALGLVGLLCLVFVMGWFAQGQAELRAEKAQIALEQERELAPLWLAVKRVLLGALGALATAAACWALASALMALGNVPNAWRWGWLRSWQVRPTRHALYPALAEPDGRGHIRVVSPVNETTAQRTAALVNGNVDRFGGSAVRQILRQDDPQAMLPEPEPTTPEYTPEQVLAPDPQNHPDTLIVGQKGSGKTNALRWMIEAYRRAMPEAEFMILSPIASNWGLPETITEAEHIREAILELREEMNRRDAAMKAAGVRDYHRWPGAPRPVVIVVDEAEAVADMIKLQSAAQAREFAGTLRVVVNMGRNFGFLIVQGTQTARADVMDPAFMHNAATLLMMRMDASTAARFNQYDKAIVAALPMLPPGRAYCPQAGGYVSFPLVKDIHPPRISPIYRAPKLLPGDPGGNGLGANQTVTVNAAGTGTVLEPQNGRVYAAEGPWTPGTVPVPEPPQRIERRRPTAEEAAAMRAHYRRTHSQTAVCMAFYGYKNGDCWDWVGQALRGEL